MLKDKIAISIDSQLLNIIDSKLDGSVLRSRSQAIEYFIKKGLAESSISTAVLLLKGKQQDSCLKLLKSKPLIKNQVEFFRNYGIDKIYLITQNPSQQLIELSNSLDFEVIDKDAKGNAGALLHLKGKIKSSFIVMSGDTYNNFELSRMIRKHLELNKLAVMGLMTRERSSDYGTAILDGDFIIDFKEKARSSSHIVNAGIYIFKPEVFELMEGDSLERDLFPKLAKIKELIGFFTYGEYEHFG